MTKTATSDTSTVLEIKDLQTHFVLETSIVRAVEGISLTLDSNKTLGLVGESGCGKSVTARSIMRLIQSPPGKIAGGQILFHKQNGNGSTIDIAALNPRGAQMRSIRGGEIAMVFQEPMTSLNPLYTVGAQIAESVQLHQKVSRSEAMSRALEMLNKANSLFKEIKSLFYLNRTSSKVREVTFIREGLKS